MKLLLIRHAVAEEGEEFAATGRSDDLRPLSAEGRRRMERGARGLMDVVPRLDLLAASPLVRARETAEIVVTAYGGLEIVETDTLAPGAAPGRFLAWLAGREVAGVAAAVGHQPHLGRLAADLLGVGPRAAVAVKKGSAILFELGPEAGPGSATLLWSLAPAHLRRLGG